ncbi:hypothetical protein EQM13_09015 [Acidilutibacter cellobiosedens]|uniref:Uncharacterized protein n=1 Tax=Acidilutibacter cellobiosedens TaxID=2507161 RepID=A0A410QCJ0_9FIRM|nr:hypothetical protein [Acidilutibacter cellobiosedens]MBE6082038.1 hypothetical protein [Tissierellaceae bacterium]QAT61717.1 hypothetical protein EQM13_09015 [Acidilutibacter cellobiosedens]
MDLFNKMEKFVLFLSIVFFAFTILIQVLNLKGEDSIFTSQFTNKAKFISINDINEEQKGTLIIKLLDEEYDDVKILVNGDTVSDFSKNNEIELSVFNNDLIEVDGSKYIDNIRVKVVGISKNIESPSLNTSATTNQSIEIIGKVVLK